MTAPVPDKEAPTRKEMYDEIVQHADAKVAAMTPVPDPALVTVNRVDVQTVTEALDFLANTDEWIEARDRLRAALSTPTPGDPT